MTSKDSKADQAKAKAQRIRDAETTTTETSHKTSAKTSHKSGKNTPQVRATNVRRTVDLAPAHHAELDAWCAETARQLGRARVTGQDVLRTLVAELLRDETTARKVRKALRENQ